jgi:hypothetical protein
MGFLYLLHHMLPEAAVEFHRLVVLSSVAEGRDRNLLAYAPAKAEGLAFAAAAGGCRLFAAAWPILLSLARSAAFLLWCAGLQLAFL